jgi:hypothetical protein
MIHHSSDRPASLPFPANIPNDDRVSVVLFYGPNDGLETMVTAPPRAYIAMESTLSLYQRTARRTNDGKLVYEYDQDGTANVRERWMQVHGY